MSISTKPRPGTTLDPLYPDSDGQPMGESDDHVMPIFHLYDALKRHFRQRDDVHVAADMFLYYDQGDPSASRAPDVMLSVGVQGNHPRRSFRLWEEHVVPAVIFEVTSRKTYAEDDKVKRRIYERLGVAEYFLFDPEGKVIKPRIKGFRLEGGRYRPLALEAAGRLTSREFGLILVVDDHLLRLVNTQTGERLLTGDEHAEAAEAAQERVAALEAELAHLRAATKRPKT